MIKKILNILSLVGMCMIVWGVIFLLQNLVLGSIPFLRDSIIFGAFRLKDVLFSVIAFLIVSQIVTFHKPHNSA
jgi:hypothetical protein